METFKELYYRLVKASLKNSLDEEVKHIKANTRYNKRHLECLLYPEKHAAVMHLGRCTECNDEPSNCQVACLFSAIKRDENGNVIIDNTSCTGCRDCIEACKNKLLTERKDLIPVIEIINKREVPVYAMIAPAFNGQFSIDVTAGKLRSAFKKLGFFGMVEVALFADILTLKEALEFDQSIHDDKDFMLTSCCCPIWVAMTKKIYNNLIPHMPPSVSPMVACGRAIKFIRPEAVTVFIGPCIAKKAEAREP
ncbi:MAG: iron hydrogenase, partial [Clostridiaceae bacterium]|nr:iron hydrogenase [Clostridiaceae bacterium]